MSRREAVNRIRHQRTHNRHVEAVGPQRGDASVAKEDGLNREGNGNGQNGSPRPQDNGCDRHPHGVPRGATGQRQVKHHHHKGKRRHNRQQGHKARGEGLLHALQGGIPERRGGSIKDRASRRAEITVRDVHGYFLNFREVRRMRCRRLAQHSIVT